MEHVEKLASIVKAIRSVNDEPMAHPGRPRESTLRLFAQIGLEPPPLLVQAYELHDGIHHLDAFLHFLPLTEAMTLYRMFEEFKEGFDDFAWQPGCFPVFDMNGNIQACIDFASGEVIVVDIEGGIVEKIADSFIAYVDALHELFESGSYAYEPVSGSIAVPDAAWRAISAKHGITGLRDLW